MKKNRFLTISIIFIVFIFMVTSVLAENLVIVDFYYSEACSECQDALYIIRDVEKHYANISEIMIHEKEVSANDTNWNEMQNLKVSYPAVVIHSKTNVTKISEDDITYDYLIKVINGSISHITEDPNIIDILGFKVNVSGISLPLVTVILGGLDSFNPCAFFILLILLSILVSLRSRWKIILVGGIFVFFSALFYFLFMIAVLKTIQLVQILIISIIAGCIAVILGGLNIKDFFFFKKGPSTSMSEEKRKKIFKKMRDLVHTAYLPSVLGGTIFLAITVNLYELLCSLGFPLIYVTRLAAEKLPTIDYYIYLVVYNVIYVIPLIVIVLVFAFTLGKMKLSEWRGRQLKLFSGGMLLSMGFILIINYMILEKFFTPIALFIGNIFATLLISFIWKKYKKEPEATTEEQQAKENI